MKNARVRLKRHVGIRLALSACCLPGLLCSGSPVGAAVGPDDPPAVYNQSQFAGHRVGSQRWQFNWRVWLPDKWQRIGACETGYGRRPGNWQHRNSQYQGAFGFAVSSWDTYKPVAWWPDEAYLATPWQQYQTALAIYRRYGLSGWGCRNA